MSEMNFVVIILLGTFYYKKCNFISCTDARSFETFSLSCMISSRRCSKGNREEIVCYRALHLG